MHSNEEEEMAVCEWLQMQQPDFYSDKVFELVASRDECVNVLEERAAKY
jgi:hypothetical protein